MDVASLPWFDARAFYGSGGYPPHTTSFSRAFSKIRQKIANAIRRVNPRRALEVGPGDVPMIRYVPDPVYVDLVPEFLRKIDHGRRVVADLRRLPFSDRSCGLVVVNDVLCHIPAHLGRGLAVSEACRVGNSVIFTFTQHVGGIEGSECQIEEVIEPMKLAGFHGQYEQINLKDGKAGWSMITGSLAYAA